MMKSNYFFLHMPKCAGTSIRALLAKQASFYHTTATSTETSVRAEVYYRNYLGVGGHLPLRNAYRLGFAQAWRFTFLRDPILRLISHLNFSAFRDPPVIDLDYFPPTLDGVKIHLSNDLLCPATSFNNSFIFFLSTVLDERAPIEEHVESSITNLCSFEFVGFQETMQEDTERLFSLLSLDPPGEVPKENVASPRAHALQKEILADAECCALIRECTKADRQIYEAVVSRRKMQPGPPVKLGRLATLQSMPVEIKSPDIQMAECTLASPTPLSPGANLEIDVALDINASELLFDLIVTIENPLEARALVQVFTYHESLAHLRGGRGTTLVNLAFPCPLNEGSYVGHIKVISTHREVIAETINAFSFNVSYFGGTPRQFGVYYFGATVATKDISLTRSLPLKEARKLTLKRDGEGPITVTGKSASVPLILENSSSLDISSGAGCRCYISYHLLDHAQRMVHFEGPRLAIPFIASGDSHRFVLPVEFPNPDLIGGIQTRIVQENVRWHEGADFDNVLPDISLARTNTD